MCDLWTASPSRRVGNQRSVIGTAKQQSRDISCDVSPTGRILYCIRLICQFSYSFGYGQLKIIDCNTLLTELLFHFARYNWFVHWTHEVEIVLFYEWHSLNGLEIEPPSLGLRSLTAGTLQYGVNGLVYTGRPQKSAPWNNDILKYDNNKTWNKYEHHHVEPSFFLWISELPLTNYSKFTKACQKHLWPLSIIRTCTPIHTCRRWKVARVGFALLLLNVPYLSN